MRKLKLPKFMRRSFKKKRPVTEDDPDFFHPNEPCLMDLFNKHRFHPFSFSLGWLLLFLWFPFGVVLGTARAILFPIFYMPLCVIVNIFNLEWMLWKFVAPFFGIITVLKNKENYHPASEAPIVISNHCTDFDGFMNNIFNFTVLPKYILLFIIIIIIILYVYINTNINTI
jgi:hypothetical protein